MPLPQPVPVHPLPHHLGMCVVWAQVFKNDFLGRLQFYAADVRDADAEPKWHRLLNKSMHADKERGEMNVAVQWVYLDDAPDKAQEMDPLDAADDVSQGESVSEEDAAALREEALQAAQAAIARREAMVIPTGDFQVQVHVIEVRGMCMCVAPPSPSFYALSSARAHPPPLPLFTHAHVGAGLETRRRRQHRGPGGVRRSEWEKAAHHDTPRHDFVRVRRSVVFHAASHGLRSPGAPANHGVRV